MPSRWMRGAVLGLMALVCSGVSVAASQSLEKLRSLSVENPGNLEMRVAFASELLRQKQYAAVVTALQPVLKANGHNPQVLFPLAVALFRMGKTEKSQTLCARILAREPAHAGANKLQKALARGPAAPGGAAATARAAVVPPASGAAPPASVAAPPASVAAPPSAVAALPSPAAGASPSPAASPSPQAGGPAPEGIAGSQDQPIPETGKPAGVPADIASLMDRLAGKDRDQQRKAEKEIKEMGAGGLKVVPYLVYMVAQAFTKAELQKAPDSLSDAPGAASNALRYQVQPPYQALLVKGLSDKRVAVRRACAFCLWVKGQSGPEVDYKSLLPLAKDADHVTKVLTFKCLGKLKPAGAEDVLVAGCGETADDLRHTALGALGAIGGPKAFATLAGLLTHAHDETRRVTAIAIGENGLKSCFDPLVEAFKKEKKDYTRYWMANSLGKLEEPRAAKPLIEVLEDPKGPPPTATRQQIITALGHSKSADAYPALIKQLGVADMGYVAPAALANLKDRRAVDPLIQELQKKEKDFVEGARSGLETLVPEAPKQMDFAAWTKWWAENKAKKP